MEKSLSPTRGDRLLRVFKRIATNMREAGLSRQLIGDLEVSGASMTLHGKEMINFGLCSYLSIAEDPRVREAAKAAIDAYGTAYSSSIAYTAIPLYGELKQRLREVFDSDVVLTGTTTLGHLTALPVLVMPEDHVFVDSQTHTSVMTATQTLQATGVRVDPLPHNDLAALEEAIVADETSRRIWYLTDGVFSMRGDTSPAEALMDLIERHPRLHLYVDDAHGFGWSGLHGRGQFLDRIQWHDRVVVIVGLSKAFGTLGGAIATPNEELAETIELCGPALTFGGPIPPPNLGASIASAEIFLSEEITDRQNALMDRIRLVNKLAEQMSLPFASLEETPLWFLDVGDVKDMMTLTGAMRDAGFFLNGAGFPVVPQGHAGLRFTVTLDLSLRQIEDMLQCLNDKRLELFGETQVAVDLTRIESEEAARLGSADSMG